MLGLMLALLGLALAAAVGAIATLAAQWYLFNRWISEQPTRAPQTKHTYEPFHLPKFLAEALQSGEVRQPENCVALNLVLQFLFRELRHSPQVRRWIHRKLSAEFAEMLTNTTTGKLFDSVTVREVNLGTDFPVLRSIAVQEAHFDPLAGDLDQLDLSLDIQYSGGIQLVVDANMLLGKAAYLAVRVNHLSGQARLQFQRHPYAHWSFSFYSEPRLELAIESQFQGRPLPQVTSLIINQIRKTLKKKHTLPNYKIRYKPFFIKPGLDETVDDGEVKDLPAGSLQIAVLEVARLYYPTPPPAYVYCSLAVDASAWVETIQRAESGPWLMLDVVVLRVPELAPAHASNLGLVLKQRFVVARYQPCVLVEAVNPNSPAALAGVQCGDLLLAVDGRRVTSLMQAARLLKGSSNGSDRFILKLERRAVLRGTQQSSIPSHLPPPVPSQPMSPSLASHTLIAAQPADTVVDGPAAMSSTLPDIKEGDGRFTASVSPVLRRRKNSAEPVVTLTGSETDSDSSSPASVPGSPSKPSSSGTCGSQQPNPDQRKSMDMTEINDEGLELQRTQDVPRSQVLSFKDTFQFDVQPQHRYLNISVWGRAHEQNSITSTSSAASALASMAVSTPDQLLGHISIPLTPILAECKAAGPLSHQLHPCMLLPPDPHSALNRGHPLAGHSGFEPCLCYGDILLSFLFTPVDAGIISPHSQHTIPKVSHPISPHETSTNPLSRLGGSLPLRRHDFLRTHFNRATQCEFCGKKIWLKDAVQCRVCGMTCHKKCVARCQEAAACSDRDSSILQRLSAQPEIVTTAAEEESPTKLNLLQQGTSFGSNSAEGSRRSGLGGFLASAAAHARGLKRAGSANNLALPGGGADFGTQTPIPGANQPPSRSLPPSPQRSPQPSRKSSLAGLPFSFPGEEDVDALLEHLLAHPNDDDLMAAAKTSGKQLYVSFPLAERKMKINSMILKLKLAMDAETCARVALEANPETGRSSPSSAARNAFLIGKSEEKIQALAVLMLHFCAGLQHTQDLEDVAQREGREKLNDSGSSH